jgi:hypothetical protein
MSRLVVGVGAAIVWLAALASAIAGNESLGANTKSQKALDRTTQFTLSGNPCSSENGMLPRFACIDKMTDAPAATASHVQRAIAKVELISLFGECTEVVFPEGFPARYNRCAILLDVGPMTTMILTKAGANIESEGADQGKISENGEPLDTGSISFIGDDAFEGNAKRSIDSNHIVVQHVNYVTIRLPHPSIHFASEPNGENFQSILPAVGFCDWHDPYKTSVGIHCEASTEVGRFLFTFRPKVASSSRSQ